jgi:hypothetical protein
LTFPSLSPTSLIAIPIAQVITIAIAVTVAIALVTVAPLPPSLPSPSFVSLLKHTPPLQTPSFGWLLHFLNDWQPPKAWAVPISLFLDGSHFGTPSKGTSRINPVPAIGRLQQTHEESRHHDLGPWQMLIWQYGAKMLGLGRRQLIYFCLLSGNQNPLKISFPPQNVTLICRFVLIVTVTFL